MPAGVVSSGVSYNVSSGATGTDEIVLSGGVFDVLSRVDVARVNAGGTDFSAQISGSGGEVLGDARSATVFTGSLAVQFGGTTLPTEVDGRKFISSGAFDSGAMRSWPPAARRTASRSWSRPAVWYPAPRSAPAGKPDSTPPPAQRSKTKGRNMGKAAALRLTRQLARAPKWCPAV